MKACESEMVVEEEEAATTEAEDSSSFVVQLVHRDSISNDSRNSTVKERVQKRLKRDSARVKSINVRVEMKVGKSDSFSSSIISGASLGSGSHLTRVGMGSPPRYSYMVLDTGSDLVWQQCLPCFKCYQQKDPVFHPGASSTYKQVSCKTPECQSMSRSWCSNETASCEYWYGYGDGSITEGDLAKETMTFRGRRVSNVTVGCGHYNVGIFDVEAGILGVGYGPLSFPSQISRFGIANKFSYCFVDICAVGRSSYLMFGHSALPRSAVYTPLVSGSSDTYYYVQMSGISVGGRRLSSIPPSVFRRDRSGNGGVVIDSGTGVTRLVQTAYESMRDAFRQGMKGLKSVGGDDTYDTCYDLSGLTTMKVPTLVFHFQRGADLSLPANNILIPQGSGVFCFAFAVSTDNSSTIGEFQQQGFRVAFDLQSNRVGFAAASC